MKSTLNETGRIVSNTNKNEILMAAMASVGIQKGYGSVQQCFEDTVIKGYVIALQEELQKAQGFDGLQTMQDDDIISFHDYIQNQAQGGLNRMVLEQAEDLTAESGIKNILLSCKTNGIMPYWLTKTIACILACCDENCLCQPQSGHNNTTGLQQAIAKRLHLQRDPELVLMIADDYMGIRKDIANLFADDTRLVKMMKKAWSLGFAYEQTYKGCGQCTIKATGEVSGNFDENVFKACTAIAGGIAGCCDSACGAYAGGVMQICLFFNRGTDDLDKGVGGIMKANAVSQKLHERFMACYGGTNCKDVQRAILGREYNLREEKDRNEWNTIGATIHKCPVVIGNACAWVVRILYDENLIE